MNKLHSEHNANLLNTLPKMEPIVNYKIVDEEDPDRVEYKVEYASSKLFVKIANSIFTLQLKPRILEFYFFLAFIAYKYPTTKLSIIKLELIILQEARISISKNTINKYINELIQLRLIEKVGKYYHVYGEHNTNSAKEEIGLEIKKKDSESKTKTKSTSKGNIYHEPKTNFKPFFITIYNTDTKAGSMALELYLASKPYNFHRPGLVCKELNISRATYYKYLKDLVTKGIVIKHILKHLSYKINYYTHDYRQVLWNDYINIQDLNYMDKKYTYQDKNRERRRLREQEGYVTAHSRLWYASSMKRIMKQYKINYIKAFDNYDPEDAYLIVHELELQYNTPQYLQQNRQLNAKLIVAAILNNYNWTKIVDRRHAKFKRDQKREKEKIGNSRYMEECFGV